MKIIMMASDDNELIVVKKQHQELCLDLNLDQATSDEVWKNYNKLTQSYTLEGDQLQWLACTLYASCRNKSVPTVGGRPGNMVQGNGVSLTRVLQHCRMSLMSFIRKMKLWLAMSHCEEDFCKRIDLLERNFAVSNNIFIKYKPIFLALFKDPALDAPRPPRSRKQRRPPCNPTELFEFCWTLYILIKGKYRSIPQDLVSCYSLLLAAIDLMFENVVKSNRKNLLNPNCEGLPAGILDEQSVEKTTTLSGRHHSIMDFLCKKFEGVLGDIRVVSQYYWKPNITDLVQNGVLKGSKDGYSLIDQGNFDHNIREIKKAYEEHLLNCGDFDERMFLSDDSLLKVTPKASPRLSQLALRSPLPQSPSVMGSRFNLAQDCDQHLIPQTPISGRIYTVNRPNHSRNPLTVATAGLQNLHSLVSKKNSHPRDELFKMFTLLKNNPEKSIKKLIDTLSSNLAHYYGQTTAEYSALSSEFIKMRVQFVQILYYTFLMHILEDEVKRGSDTETVLHQEIFHKTLFTCCIELVLKAYNDARQFPWSLQIADLQPYFFVRIIEIVIRVEKKCENYELSRELVKHLKVVEETILESLAWRSDSPLWELIKKEANGVPMCADVNYQYNLVNEQKVVTNDQAATALMSPAMRPVERSTSPVSSLAATLGSPGAQDSARRMLFPSAGIVSTVNKVENQQKRTRPIGLAGNLVSSGPSDKNTKEQSHVAAKPQASPMPLITPSNRDKPKRGGSFAIFFRKFFTLAHMRLVDLCDRLEVEDEQVKLKIWTCFEHSVSRFTHLLLDRHMDQMIMCAIYITLKVTVTDRNFQEIMKHYRSQPQASSHIYRSVLISKSCKPSPSMTPRPGPPPTPSQMTGTSSNLPSGERGDLIKFYNNVYVKELKSFAQTLSANTKGCPAVLSPTPHIRRPPVSPRKRVSENHRVYINTAPLSPSQLNPLKPPAQPLPYFFNRSPAKDLRVINTVISNGSPRKFNFSGEPDRKRPRTDTVNKSILFPSTPNAEDKNSQPRI